MPRQFLPALRGALQTKGLAERVRSSAVAYTVAGTPYVNNWNVDRAVREGFQANPWIFRSVEVIAYTSLRRKVVIRQGDPDEGTPLRMAADPTRVLFRLNRRSNKWESAKLFRYRLIAQFLLSSRGVFIEVTRSRSGAIAMLTLLDPDLVDMVPSVSDPIGAFVVRTTGDTGGRRDALPPFDADDSGQRNSVLWIRSPHPTMLTRGMSPMEAAGLSIDLDRYARLYNRDYMQAGGRPGGILGVRGSVSPETVVNLQNRFNNNARPGETSVITADNMFYQDLSTAPRDMQWGEVMDRMRKESSMTFGVPESMMGDASGRTFDNADAEYAIFLEHRFAPFIELIDDQLDVLTGQEEDDNWLRHDLSDVWVLKRHRRADEDRMAADLDRGAITMNEYREFKGLDPIDAPWAKVCWITPQRAAGWVEDAGQGKDAASLPVLGQPDPNAGAGAGMGAPPGGDQYGNPVDPAAMASLNAQTNANAGLRLIAADGQGRSPDGGTGQLELASAHTPDVEGKQGGGRAPATSTTWR